MNTISNQRWSDAEFDAARQEVLSSWPTGAQVNLEEAVAYHAAMPPMKNAARRALAAKNQGETLLCPSLGSDTVANHTALLQHMEKEGEADILTSYIDSFTRNCLFERAQEGLAKAQESGRPVLNGFPFAIHGVEKTRQVINAIHRPVMMFGPSPDARLTHEIGLAGGHTGYSGGPLISFWNYTKDVPVAQLLRNFQYVNRLMGRYEEMGVPILYAVSGAMPSISPPSLMIAPEIIEVLIAAAQGVKHIQLNNWLQGHLIQDLAGIRVFRKLAREYLDAAGHTDVQTVTYSVSPTGRFPTSQEQVYALISYFTMIGSMGNVQICGSRTIDEAHHIPTPEGSAKSFRNARMFLSMMGPQGASAPEGATLETECAMVEKEVRAILDAVLELGKGDIAQGTVLAVESGILDQPYSTSQQVAGRVLGVKDATGAARFYDFGNLPLDEEIKAFHREKIAEREALLGHKTGYDTIVADLTAIADGAILPVA
ncbi:MAG: methylaspartate mutase subunit E [Spirochaetales bacterium]|nr:methylaspartate mutase subunit E [Spirochaetales bacterium]